MSKVHPIEEAFGPDDLQAATREAHHRLERRAALLAPKLHDYLTTWIRRLTRGASPECYFLHPNAFPSLLLPWVMETTLTGQTNSAHAADLVYSTMAGYYAIRLIDDVMDGEANADAAFLPLTAFLHSEFERPYHALFPFGDPFWDEFDRDWARTVEATIEDSLSLPFDMERFARVAARKVLAGRIPMWAVARTVTLAGIPENWEIVFNSLSLFHQMRNDLFDWQRDAESDASTFFLSHARRHLEPGEPIAIWFVREGFEWAVDLLNHWLDEARLAAAAIGSDELDIYLTRRNRDLAHTIDTMRPGLAAFATLASAGISIEPARNSAEH